VLNIVTKVKLIKGKKKILKFCEKCFFLHNFVIQKVLFLVKRYETLKLLQRKGDNTNVEQVFDLLIILHFNFFNILESKYL
jgi:hypothetical protein